MSPILKKALRRERLYNMGITCSWAWLASLAIVALFAAVGTIERGM